MAGEYIVPLGVDGKKVISGFDEIINGVDRVTDKAAESGKAMEDAFKKGAKGAELVNVSLAPTKKLIDGVGEASKKTGRDLVSALDIKEAGGVFSKQVDSFKKQLDQVTQKRKMNLEVDAGTIKNLEEATNYLKNNFDEIQKTFSAATAKLGADIDTTKQNIAETESVAKDLTETLEKIAPGQQQQELRKELNAVNQALKEDKAALQDYENQLASLDGANENLAKTLSDATKSVDDLKASTDGSGDSSGKAAVKVKTFRAELVGIKNALVEMELKGEAGSQTFVDMTTRAVELQDQIDGTAKQIRTLASDTKTIEGTISGVTGLVGAFTLAQGAVGLFGAENEELNEALLKVNSAMAVLQGLQAVSDTLNKDSAFSVVFLRNARVADATATGVQTTATTVQTTAMRAGTLASRAFGLALKGMGIGLIIGLIAYMVENWDKLKESLNSLLPVGKSVGGMFDSIKSYAMGAGNVILQYLITPFKALTALLTGDMDGFKKAITDGLSFKQNFTEGFNKQEARNNKKHLDELERQNIEAAQRDLDRRRNRGEDISKQEIALQQRRVALAEKGSKEYKEELTELEDLQDDHFKTTSDAQAKAAEEAKKKREEAHKKQLEQQKATDAQVLAYTRELRALNIAAIADAAERERAAINEEYRIKQEDLIKDGAASADVRKKQSELAQAIEAERVTKIADLEKKSALDRLKIQIEAQKVLADLSEEGMSRDLELLRIDHEQRQTEIQDQYKNEETLRLQLLAALDKSTAAERKKILNAGAKKALEEEMERQVLTIELASEYAKKSEKTERQKQIAILETQIEFSQKYLDSLTASGASSNSLQVLQARKQLQELKKALGEEVKANSGQGFDFMEFIGLGGLDDDQKGAVKKAAAATMESLGQITDFIVDQYQRQIDKKQESIDQLDTEIGDLEDRLDEEKDLRDSGFANNVAAIEAELAEKQRQKDEEVRQQEELQKKQQALQRAQMAVDTAVQLVNMITSSTQIFKALSGIPFIGVPLAIATIGTMFGAFTLSKIKAAQSINAQKFEKGGWIDGKSHAQGGKKYYSPDGDVTELEKGEFVVRQRQAKKFSNMLEAINEGSFTGFDMHDAGLREMLAGMGIDLSEHSAKAGLQESKSLETMKLSITVNATSNSKEMAEMNENIKFLAQAERERTTSWNDDKYIYVKTGSKTTRIAKEPKKEVENG